MTDNSAAKARELLREGYTEWKSWESTEPPDDEVDAYAGEIHRAQIRAGERVVELGFGNGGFLKWANRNGIRVVGLDVVPELVRRAREHGWEAHLVEDERPLGPFETGDFDAVVAFDVLEHLNQPQLFRLASSLGRCLKPGGKLLARFPNGSSPFGRHYQNGDLTHASALTESSIRQIFEPHGFALRWARDCYVAPGRSPTKRLVRAARRSAQFCISASLSQIYWGRNIPLAPNLTALLAYEP